jgi:hypothetical protein
MKTTNQNNSKNNFRTILYSGIVTTLFVATSFAKVSEMDQQVIESESILTSLICSATIAKPEINLDSENEIKNSVALIASSYVKPIEETIIENEQIIESKEDFNLPIYSGRTIDEIILENEMIIESNRVDDTFPLNSYLMNNSSVDNRNGIIVKNNSELKS